MGDLVDIGYKVGGAVLVMGQLAFAWLLLKLSKEFISRKEFAKYAETMETIVKGLTDRLNAHGERLTQGDVRFNKIDAKMETLPSAEQISTLNISLERVVGDMKVGHERLAGVADQLKQVRNQVQIMDDHLRSQG